MTNRLPALKAREIIRVLKQLGFYEVRQKGAHLCFRNTIGKFTIVPVHTGEDIGRGLLRKILNDIGISEKDLLKLL